MSGSIKPIKVKCWQCQIIFEKMIEKEILFREIGATPPTEIIVFCPRGHENKVYL